MLKVGLGNDIRRFPWGSDRCRQLDVKVELIVVLEVRQRLWLLLLVGHGKRREGIHRNHPRRDRGAEAEKGFRTPLLVACKPGAESDFLFY